MSIIDHTGIMEAVAYATTAHGNQKRKYTGEPYIVHPIAVATMIARHGGTLDMIKVALLHDTIEDCGETFQSLQGEFGGAVANMVMDLTERYHDGNRAVRKDIECARLSRVSATTQTIKVADLIDNTKSIVAEDPAFARVYLVEKIALLKALTKADPRLKTIAYEQIMNAQAELLEGEA